MTDNYRDSPPSASIPTYKRMIVGLLFIGGAILTISVLLILPALRMMMG